MSLSTTERKKFLTRGVLVLLTSLYWVSQVEATHQNPMGFLSDSFPGRVPAPKVIWISAKLRSRIEEIVKHRYKEFRLRYWAQGRKTVWILHDTVRSRLVSVGIAVDGSRIQKVEILLSTSKRGKLIRNHSLTDQFRGAALSPDNELDRNIDGISGATLSVAAVSRLAQLALFLHKATERPLE